jgi:DNA-binding MarR family transcriptional regulator
VPPASASTDDLHVAIVRLARAHRAELARQLGGVGLHPGQEQLLAQLWMEDGRTQADLAEVLGVEPPTVTKMIGRLEVAGFVVRHPHPEDRRATQVWLTDAGWGVRRDVQRALARVARRTTAGMSERQQASLRTLMAQAAGNLGA